MNYLTDLRNSPHTCLPENLDTTNLIEITTSKDMWKQFYDPSNQKIYNCEDYYNESIRQRK